MFFVFFFRARCCSSCRAAVQKWRSASWNNSSFYDIPLLFIYLFFPSRGWAICSESHQSSPWVQGRGVGEGVSGGRGGQRGGEVEWVAWGERWRAAEWERERERGEGESMHSDWEFICHSQAQSYFKRLTRDVEKGEMRPLMWNDMPDDGGRGEKRGGERPLWITAIEAEWDQQFAAGGRERWGKEETDRFGLQSCGSMPQSRPQQRRLMDLTPRGTLPLSFPSLHPAPPLMIHPPTSSPPPSPRCLHHDSHPLPELNYRRGPSEGSITLPPSSAIIKQVYELRPVPDCIEEPSSAVFMRPRVWAHTRTHTLLALMALFFLFFFFFLREEFSIFKCLSVYKWWRRVDLVEGSVIPRAGHYKCWLDGGWVEYLITGGPIGIPFIQQSCHAASAAESAANNSNSCAAPSGWSSQTQRCEKEVWLCNQRLKHIRQVSVPAWW